MPERTGPRVVLLIGSRGVVTAAPMGWSAVRIGAIVMRQSVAGDVRSTDARAGRGAPDRGDPAAAERCARSCATVCLRLHPGSFPGATGTRTPRRRRPRSSWRSRSSRRPRAGTSRGSSATAIRSSPCSRRSSAEATTRSSSRRFRRASRSGCAATFRTGSRHSACRSPWSPRRDRSEPPPRLWPLISAGRLGGQPPVQAITVSSRRVAPENEIGGGARSGCTSRGPGGEAL
jgi:hypothetical protein